MPYSAIAFVTMPSCHHLCHSCESRNPDCVTILVIPAKAGIQITVTIVILAKAGKGIHTPQTIKTIQIAPPLLRER